MNERYLEYLQCKNPKSQLFLEVNEKRLAGEEFTPLSLWKEGKLMSIFANSGQVGHVLSAMKCNNLRHEGVRQKKVYKMVKEANLSGCCEGCRHNVSEEDFLTKRKKPLMCKIAAEMRLEADGAQ